MGGCNRIISTLLLYALALSASAQGVGDSKRLLCALTEASECSFRHPCLTGGPHLVNIPSFVKIDLQAKLVTASRDEGDDLSSPIVAATTNGNTLVIQGVENERGWNASIDKASGKMTVSVSGSDLGFVVFGACAPLDGQ